MPTGCLSLGLPRFCCKIYQISFWFSSTQFFIKTVQVANLQVKILKKCRSKTTSLNNKSRNEIRICGICTYQNNIKWTQWLSIWNFFLKSCPLSIFVTVQDLVYLQKNQCLIQVHAVEISKLNSVLQLNSAQQWLISKLNSVLQLSSAQQ